MIYSQIRVDCIFTLNPNLLRFELKKEMYNVLNHQQARFNLFNNQATGSIKCIYWPESRIY